MKTTLTYLLLACSFAVASGCGVSVEEACDNLSEQCDLNDAQHVRCIEDGEARDEQDDFADGALNCVAEATTCEEATACETSMEGRD